MSGTTPTVTTEPTDQPLIGAIEVAGSETAEGLAQAEKLLLPSGGAAFYVFSQEWHSVFNGVTLQFRPAVGYEIDGPLLAFLNAQSAPITAV